MPTLYKVSLGLATLFFFAIVGLCGWCFLYTRDLPDIDPLSEFAPTQGHLATDSCLSGLSFAVPFERIGKSFQNALASAEPGISFSDQIARTLMCDRQESAARYQLDIFRLSRHIRSHFSEQQLLTIYVNRVYFGPGATGVQNASEHLLQKDAAALSPEEAALLAGVIRAPAIFSPFKYPDKALQRRNRILEAMAAQGKLSATELANSIRLPILLLSRGNTEQKALPHGVLEALSGDESEYCDQFETDFKKGCEETFQANLMWLRLQLVPRGVPAILVQNNNMGFCGTAGCALRLFMMETDGRFAQILGRDGEVGSLDQVRVLKTITHGHFDIQKKWRDDKRHTIYRWQGSGYSAD